MFRTEALTAKRCTVRIITSQRNHQLNLASSRHASIAIRRLRRRWLHITTPHEPSRSRQSSRAPPQEEEDGDDDEEGEAISAGASEAPEASEAEEDESEEDEDDVEADVAGAPA